MSIDIITVIARQEFLIATRARWIAVFSAVFSVLALAIAYFGTATAGVAGVQGFERTTASLLNLVLYLVPLLGLMLGTLALSRDRAGNELLFSQPVRRQDVLYGRVIGTFCGAAVAMLVGFGVAGIVVLWEIGAEGFSRFGGVVVLSLALAAVFVSLGALAGVICTSRTRAFGLALCLWFFFVLFYDLLIIGLTFLLRERTANLMIFLSLFGNPVDLVRISTVLSIGDPSIFGAAGAVLLRFLGGPALSQVALGFGIAAWFVAPMWVASRILRRLDL
jgi:Cu-processing system permease protein